MLLVFACAAVVFATLFAVFYFLLSKEKKATLELSSKVELFSQSNRELEKEIIALQTQRDFLSKQLSDTNENQQFIEENLKTNLTNLAKNFIQEGSEQLRTSHMYHLDNLLKPFKEKLESFEKEVKNTNEKGLERYTALSTTIRELTEQHQKINSTAQNLADALRGNQKTQGDWGELALERILEMSGLIKGREYQTQANFKDDDDRNQRPDVVINLPENKHIIIDSKVSLVAFERAINSDSEEDYKIQLSAHLTSLKTHIKQLSEKNYIHLKGIDSPEFVLLFIPLESSFALAMKEEPTLYQFAWEKKIVLVTPSTLLATLKTVESIWKQERQNKHALDIAEQAGKIYDKFVGFVQDLEQVGKKQKDASQAYEEAMKKLQLGSGNLINATEKLKKMGAKAKKQLDTKYLDENAEE